VNTPDPVQLGLVESLNRPGGNVTGTTTLSADLSAKQLELLKHAVPRAGRVAVLWNPDNPWHARRGGCARGRPVARRPATAGGGATSGRAGQGVRHDDEGTCRC